MARCEVGSDVAESFLQGHAAFATVNDRRIGAAVGLSQCGHAGRTVGELDTMERGKALRIGGTTGLLRLGRRDLLNDRVAVAVEEVDENSSVVVIECVRKRRTRPVYLTVKRNGNDDDVRPDPMAAEAEVMFEIELEAAVFVAFREGYF